MRQKALLPLFLAALVISASAAPAGAQEDLDSDARVEQELRALNPAAADFFARANAARQAERHGEAIDLYARVVELVPSCQEALRGQGYELLWVADREAALRVMRQALAIEETPANLRGVIDALLATSEQLPPMHPALQEAARLVYRARKLARADPELALLACQLSLLTDDPVRLGREVASAEQLAPMSPWTHYFKAISLLDIEDRKGARRSLGRATVLGLPPAVAEPLARELEKPGSPIEEYGGKVGWVLAAWVALFLVLLGLGALLSQATLAASRRVPRAADGRPSGWDARLRSVYRGVLWACCIFYYVSMPLIFGLVLIIGGGLIYLMLVSGHLPVKLLIIVVIVTFATMWAILRSLFVRGRDEDPGLKAGPREHPRLRKVLDEVAARVGTRAVTHVYLTPGTEIAVMERGGLRRQLSGQSERCLILGIGALPGMKLRPFKAILAHEYGHFSNRDTAGGGFALAVRRSLITTAVSLAQGGAAAWYNPAWLFVNGFYRIFLRVSQGASRLQEVLADRWAAFSYGAAAFREGLRHVIDRSIRFDVHVNSVLAEVIEQKRPLSNLYAYQPAERVEDTKFAEALEAAITQQPSPYDSHPRPADRFAWVESLRTEGAAPEPSDGDAVWSLFDDREALDRRFTDTVRDNLREGRGIEIPAGETAGDGTGARGRTPQP